MCCFHEVQHENPFLSEEVAAEEYVEPTPENAAHTLVHRRRISWTELTSLYIYIYIISPGWIYIYIYVCIYATVGWLNAFGESHHVSGGL